MRRLRERVSKLGKGPGVKPGEHQHLKWDRGSEKEMNREIEREMGHSGVLEAERELGLQEERGQVMSHFSLVASLSRL